MSKRNRVHGAVAVCLFLVAAAVAPAGASAVNRESHFAGGTDGWSVVLNDAADPFTEVQPTFSPSGGNPGGHIRVTDAAADSPPSGPFPYTFVSPLDWAGNGSANFGGELSFDFSEAGGTRGPIAYVTDDDGNTLARVTSQAAAGGWTHYDLTLSTSEPGWLYAAQGAGAYSPAAPAGFTEVLPDIEEIAIQGDSVQGLGDVGRLDNVRLLEGGDGDGDGVANPADACPFEPGAASNGGCPPPPDGDGDGDGGGEDAPPPEPTVTPPPPPPSTTGDDACADAEAALAKATRKLRKAKQAVKDASGKKAAEEKAKKLLAKAKKKVRKARAAVSEACG